MAVQQMMLEGLTRAKGCNIPNTGPPRGGEKVPRSGFPHFPTSLLNIIHLIRHPEIAIILPASPARNHRCNNNFQIQSTRVNSPAKPRSPRLPSTRHPAEHPARTSGSANVWLSQTFSPRARLPDVSLELSPARYRQPYRIQEDPEPRPRVAGRWCAGRPRFRPVPPSAPAAALRPHFELPSRRTCRRSPDRWLPRPCCRPPTPSPCRRRAARWP